MTGLLGDQKEVGLRWMASLGFGLELDASALDHWAMRWRMVARYRFGLDVYGWSLGMAVGF